MALLNMRLEAATLRCHNAGNEVAASSRNVCWRLASRPFADAQERVICRAIKALRTGLRPSYSYSMWQVTKV